MSTDGSSAYNDYVNQKEDVKNFETGRIKALQEERLHIQKKTFTKWINSFLIKVCVPIMSLLCPIMFAGHTPGPNERSLLLELGQISYI